MSDILTQQNIWVGWVLLNSVFSFLFLISYMAFYFSISINRQYLFNKFVYYSSVIFCGLGVSNMFSIYINSDDLTGKIISLMQIIGGFFVSRHALDNERKMRAMLPQNNNVDNNIKNILEIVLSYVVSAGIIFIGWFVLYEKLGARYYKASYNVWFTILIMMILVCVIAFSRYEYLVYRYGRIRGAATVAYGVVLWAYIIIFLSKFLGFIS